MESVNVSWPRFHVSFFFKSSAARMSVVYYDTGGVKEVIT